jgi:hypothetical protein
MDLVDMIEKRRFVGREFLVWLWFESELFESRFDIDGFGPCEIWLEGQITLVQDKEQSRLKGVAPSTAKEAHEALRQGKLPTQARVRVTRGELEFGFLFNTDALSLSAVKIPNIVKEEADEQFYERMYLVEELDALFGALYAKFIALRLGAAWEETVAPAIRTWVRDEPVLDLERYRKVRARVPALSQVKRPMTVPPPAEVEAPEGARQQVA